MIRILLLIGPSQENSADLLCNPILHVNLNLKSDPILSNHPNLQITAQFMSHMHAISAQLSPFVETGIIVLNVKTLIYVRPATYKSKAQMVSFKGIIGTIHVKNLGKLNHNSFSNDLAMSVVRKSDDLNILTNFNKKFRFSKNIKKTINFPQIHFFISSILKIMIYFDVSYIIYQFESLSLNYL
jgi:hypothetical protein